MRVEVWYSRPFEWAEKITNRLTGRWRVVTTNGDQQIDVEVTTFFGLFTKWLDSDWVQIEVIETVVCGCSHPNASA